MNIEDLLNQILEHLKSVAKTETVVGQQFTLGEFTCVPIIRIGMGFGSGSGDDGKKGKGGGVGGGLGVEPIGFLVTKGGEVSFISAKKGKGIEAIFDKVPDLMEKMMEMKNKE